MLSKIALLLFAVCMTSCVTNPQPLVVRPPEQVIAKTGKGEKITIHRGYTVPVAMSAHVFVDGVLMGYVASHSMNTFEIQPGQHQLRIKWSRFAGLPESIRFFELKRGESLHFEITSDVAFYGTISSVGTGIRPVDKATADRLTRLHPSREEE